MGAERESAGRGRPSPKQCAQELAIEQRRARVEELRVKALSIREIAAEVGVSIGTVHSDLMAVLDRAVEKADDICRREREISLRRIDIAIKSLMDRAEAGDLEAIDRLVKLDVRRARLLGLDAPAKQEIAGPGGGPIPMEAKSSLESKLDALGKRLGGAEPGRAAGARPASEG